MPIVSFQSPRDAIRDWLAHVPQITDAANTEVRRSAAGNGGQHRSTRHNRGERRQYETEGGVSRGRQSGHLDDLTVGENHMSKPIRDEHLGLAKQLGLHAPFQAMERRAIDEQFQTKDIGVIRKKKRKRSSSISSYLEPATFDGPDEANHKKRDNDTERQLTCSDHRTVGGTPSLSGSSRLDMQAVSSPKPAKSYERKPRHKTKKDKYDLKQSKKSEKAPTKRKDPTTKKTKRKEKSGAALLHNFTAKNVALDRLTLKPTTKLGLFTKGRASSPIRRRGLPDLSFSEINFLNARREDPIESSTHTNREMTKKRNNVADSHEEMSRFFESTTIPLAKNIQKAPAHDINHSPHHETRATEQSHDHRSSIDVSPLPPLSLDLPGRPFLGFGERGSHLPSPDNMPEGLDTRMQRRSSSHPTNYHTWSRSPTRSLRHNPGRRPPIGSNNVSPDKSLVRELPNEIRSSQSQTGLDNDGIHTIQKTTPESATHHLLRAWSEEKMAKSHSKVGFFKPNHLGKSTSKGDYTSPASKETKLRSATEDSINNSLEPNNAGTTNAEANTAEVNTLCQNELDDPVDKEDFFTEALDEIFDLLESGNRESNTRNELKREACNLGIRSIRQTHGEMSARPKAWRENGRLRINATDSGGIEDCSTEPRVFGVCEQSPMFSREQRVAANPSPLSTQRTASQLQRPDNKLPSPLDSNAWRRPKVAYGQELEARKPGSEYNFIPHEYALHGSRGSSLGLSTARAYGTPVSLDQRPFAILNTARSHTPQMFETHAEPFGNHFGKNRYSEGVSRLQGGENDRDVRLEEQAQTEMRHELGDPTLEINDTHNNYEADAHALEQPVSQERNGSGYSNRYSFKPESHHASYRCLRIDHDSPHRSFAPNIFQAAGQHRLVTQPKDTDEPGLSGFWKPNKLY